MMEESIGNRRYLRQLILPEVGETGQQKIREAKVLVVGSGGLGSPVLYYLAAAGIGTLGIVDSDVVEMSNLQRQILHWEKDLGRPKVFSAAEKLTAFNSEVHLETYYENFDLSLALELIPRYDLTIAAVDNLESRAVINQASFAKGKPWIEGGVSNFSGLVTTFIPPQGPCFRCLYPDLPGGEKKPIGLLGVLPGVIGVLQAQEALKLILGIGQTLAGKLLYYDSLALSFNLVEFSPLPDCPVCGH